MTETKRPCINGDRLLETLERLAQIGQNENGGIDRALGSRADADAREWICKYWEGFADKPVRIDPIANLWLRADGTESLPPLVIGSHHDAVPNGGRFDGALGVLMATEVMRTLRESDVRLRHPLELVSFTGEEPNPFLVSTLGSKVLSGRLVREDLQKLTHCETGEPLQSAIRKIGGDITRAKEARIQPGQIAAFVECHIEQGKRLLGKDLPLASVDRITGIYREIITVSGEANHAGTTMMCDRKDALVAASHIILRVEEFLRLLNSDQIVATIGKCQVLPGAANIIPGQVRLTLDLRSCDDRLKALAIEAIGGIARKVEHDWGVTVRREVNLDQPLMVMDPEVLACVGEGIRSVGAQPVTLGSMAGHDAANMQRVTRSGMLFVRSVDGKSHCPEEYTTDEDVVLAGNALLETVLKLDKELDKK